MSLMIITLVVIGILTLAVSIASVGLVSKQPDRRLWRYMDSKGLIKFENYNIMTTVEYVRLREGAMQKGRNWGNIVEGVAVIGTAEAARKKVKYLKDNSRLLWRGLHARKFDGRRIILAEAESIISEQKAKRHN